LGISLWSPGILKSLPLVVFAWHRGGGSSPRLTLPKNPLPLLCFDHPCRRRPPMLGRQPAGTLARPRNAETHPAHPTLPLGIAMATESTRSGQSATDHSPTRHLATGPVPTPLTNSLSRPCLRPTVRVTSTTPSWRAQPEQSAQRGCHVPTRAEPLLRRRSRTPAQHLTHGTLPPLPSPLVHRSRPTVHHFPCMITEPDTVAAEPTSHRRHSPAP
jgi:hypothetical protein